MQQKPVIELCVCQHPLAAHEAVSVSVVPRDICYMCKDSGRRHPCEQFTAISTGSKHFYSAMRLSTAVPKKIVFLAKGDRILFRFDGLLLVPSTTKNGALVAEVTGEGHFHEGRELWVAKTELGETIPWPRKKSVLSIPRRSS